MAVAVLHPAVLRWAGLRLLRCHALSSHSHAMCLLLSQHTAVPRMWPVAVLYCSVLGCAALCDVVFCVLYYVVMFMWFKGFPGGSVKNPPAVQETWV